MPYPIKPFYIQNLPHIQPVGESFFVTFRLHGSLPVEVIYQLKKKYDQRVEFIKKENHPTLIEQEKISRERAVFFKNYDDYLDSCFDGPTHLKTKEIAEVVMKEIHRFDDELYELFAFCIMPNHVHLLIGTNIQLPNGYFPTDALEDLDIKPLYEIMRRIKGASARYANKILDVKGAFWQHESYDHYVRSSESFRRILAYIANNPVKAKLAKNWKDWPYTYIAPKFIPQ